MNTVKEYQPIMNTGIQLAYENLIRKNNFDTFITITFRAKYQQDTIKKKIRDFLAHVNDNDVIFYENLLNTWLFIERNSYNSSNHVHLLAKDLDPDKYPLLEKELFKFGHSQVKRCHDNSIPYLASKCATNKLLDDQPMCIHSRRDKVMKKKNRIASLTDNVETGSASNEILALNTV